MPTRLKFSADVCLCAPQAIVEVLPSSYLYFKPKSKNEHPFMIICFVFVLSHEAHGFVPTVGISSSNPLTNQVLAFGACSMSQVFKECSYAGAQISETVQNKRFS